MEEDSSTPRRQPQNWRSQASNNWRVPDSSPRPEQQSRPQRGSTPRGTQNEASEATPGTRLYVGNLLYTAQTADVEQLFTDNGYAVAKVTMSTDPFTGRNPSYCFVDLSTPEEAAQAMAQLNGLDVLGRAVRINPGVAKKAGEGGPQARIRNYENGSGRRESGSSNDHFKPSFDRWSRNDAPAHSQAATEQGKRCYVGGLPKIEPQSAVDAEMQKVFEGFSVQAVSKIISPHASKAEEPGNHHYLFVDLASTDEVDAAIQTLDKSQSPWGGELRVSRAKDNRDRKPREQFGSREQFGGSEPREPRAPRATPWRSSEPAQ